MRPLLVLVPLGLLLVGLAGFAACRATGRDPHVSEMLVAAGVALAASIAAAVPLVLVRGASQYAASQAGLVATVAHLFVATGLAGALMLSGRLRMPLVYWLLAFYWATLVGVVAGAVRAVRSAPPEGRPADASPPPPPPQGTK